jgi:hypothetical protein
MQPSLKNLAAQIDGLTARDAATVSETPSALTVAGLAAGDAEMLVPSLTELGWPFGIVDEAGERADPGVLSRDFEPFIVTITKPAQDGTLRVVTREGFRNFLANERDEEIWEVASLANQFATMRTSFQLWGTSAIFSPAPATKSPRELVREHNVPAKAPSDIRAWMLRSEASETLWVDETFQSFAELSARSLMRALSGEIRGDGGLVFNGPPFTQFLAPDTHAAIDLGLTGFNRLRAAAAWVYENAAEAEQRHGLFVAELARTHPEAAGSANAFASVVRDVLQGSRLAYQLSLSDMTREAIKAQGDLRKAVADDTAKLADNTRQVVTAITAALATCVGLVAAKLGTSTPSWVLNTVAWIAACYVAAIIVSGILFLCVQRDMRKTWRTRLYRFIPEADYKAMVLEPTQQAENMFIVTSVAGGIVAVLEIALVAFYG